MPSGDRLRDVLSLYVLSLGALSISATHFAIVLAQDIVLPGYIYLLGFDEVDYDITASSAAPIAFNLIDTSNLTDHVGPLNALSAAIPRLRHDQLSMPQTESFTPLEEDPRNDFQESLCMPPSTFALLTGVIPVSYLSRFSSRFIMHGTASSSLSTSFDGPKQRLSMEARTLSGLLFKSSLKLFAVESSHDLMKNMTGANMRQASTSITFDSSYKLARDDADTDGSDRGRQTMKMNYFQDLCCKMYQQEIFTVEHLRYSDRHTAYKGVFRQWQTIPAVIVVRALVHLHSNAISSLGICITLCTPQFAFGSVDRTPEGVTIREDPLGQCGTSHLVVCTKIPAWLLCLDPAATVIKFCIRSTSGTAVLHCWIPSLGMDMALYKAPLLDEKLVFNVRDSPQLVDASLSPVESKIE
ncbi:hypothetical protein IW261DRAFT_1602257 [Armillaria novae-zelandiae]|uniref:Uncharacterized protein n=1 Tax=Armillaria novae-zelandiae TaxID=153914 RepID=A0AA39PVZ1_9AGAR|nr:hypothetical protein IW261DRAFT_1602257 [Armillaria novae-zelandiae]